MKSYRKLTDIEIAALKSQMCMAEDWTAIEVAEGFATDHILHARFSGTVRLGSFKGEFELAGGMRRINVAFCALELKKRFGAVAEGHFTVLAECVFGYCGL